MGSRCWTAFLVLVLLVINTFQWLGGGTGVLSGGEFGRLPAKLIIFSVSFSLVHTHTPIFVSASVFYQIQMWESLMTTCVRGAP